MDLDSLVTADNCDVLFGDGSAVFLPPSLLTSAAVIDLAMHPHLPILTAGLVTGEVEVHEYRGCETRRRPITQQYFKEKGTSSSQASPYNLRMHQKGCISSMEFTEDGNYLVTASSDRTITVLDCVAEQIVLHISSKTTTKNESQRSTGGKCNGSKSGSSSANVGLRKKKKNNPHKFGISALNVCDVNLVATGDDDGMIAIWDMRQQTPAYCYHEHGDFVSQMIYFTDIEELVSSSGDTCLGVFDLRKGRIRDYSEKRKDELNCFAFVNNSGNNTNSFIPSIVCGTPNGGLPVWKFGSWRRPYDLLERHPAECESIISFNNPDSTFNHNIILTGACDGLVRVIQMYPVRRNLCQLSARDFTYSHNSAVGGRHSGAHASAAVRHQRGNEGITRMRLSHDSAMLAVCGTDNIIDFVDVRFLSNERELDQLRSRAEQRHMAVLREMETEREEEELQLTPSDSCDGDEVEKGAGGDKNKQSGTTNATNRKRGRNEKLKEQNNRFEENSDSDCNNNNDDSSDEADEGHDVEVKTERQKKRERVAAAKWLKTDKRKKVNFAFEKRRRRVNSFFGDMFS